MTGSILFDGPHNDIDVIVLVRSLREYLDHRDEIIVPDMIGDLHCDVFFRESPVSIFMTLTLDDLKLYFNAAYKLRSVDRRLTVINTGADRLLPDPPQRQPEPMPEPLPLPVNMISDPNAKPRDPTKPVIRRRKRCGSCSRANRKGTKKISMK